MTIPGPSYAGEAGGLALLTASGALTLAAHRRGQRCPHQQTILAVSMAGMVGSTLYLARRWWRRQGGARPGGGSEEGYLYDDPERERTPRYERAFHPHDLMRKNVLELEPYRCARDDYSEGVLLDANENSFGSTLPPDMHHLELERYPDPYQVELKEKIAKFRGVRHEQIFLGVGSDEAIDILIRVFCEPAHDKILVTPPTYGMYKVCAKINNVGLVQVPLTPDFNVRVPEVLAAVKPDVKLIFLCSPGNPTAKLIPLEAVEQIAKGASRTMVVVDEAYIDFANPKVYSACRLVNSYNNIIVLQTLSKAFGLAGIRCGMAIGNEDVIRILNNVKAPYNVSKLASNAAHTAFQHLDVLEKNVDSVLKEKERIIKALRALPYVQKIHHSDTNFILFQVPNAQAIYKDMAEAGVVARYRGHELHCTDCIRVTVGKPAENDSFLQLFSKVASKYLAKIT